MLKGAHRRLSLRAAALLATVALVLALFNTGKIGIDWSYAASHLQSAAHAQGDCAEHASVAHEALHALDVDVLGGHRHDQGDPASSHDQTTPYHTHPCCVTAVVTVLPAIVAMRLPAAIGGHRVVGDRAVPLERRMPEGPTEPPRTVDMV